MVYLISPNDDRNFGAVLQAVALQHFLQDMNIDSQFVRIKKNLDYILDYRFNSPKTTVKSCFVFLHRKELRRSCAAFSDFVRKYQTCTPVYDDYDALSHELPAGDAYIVGSDQVWPETNLLPLNFMSFAPSGSRKLSYAASTGKDTISEPYREAYRRSLADFAALSVRERTAIPAFSEVYSGDIRYNVDPTLLYSADFWSDYEIEYRGRLPERYIMLYMIAAPRDINEKLKALKRKTGLPLVLVSNTPFKGIYCDKHIRDAGPGEFLRLLHRAEGVVASSYHGNIFSILYKKPFIAVNNKNKPARLVNLLDMLGLSSQLEWNDNFIADFSRPDSVDAAIEAERRRSREYFSEYLL